MLAFIIVLISGKTDNKISREIFMAKSNGY